MKAAIIFFFHKLKTIALIIYHAGKLVAQMKDEIAYIEIHAVTHDQLDKLGEKKGREATPDDFEQIPRSTVGVIHEDDDT